MRHQFDRLLTLVMTNAVCMGLAWGGGSVAVGQVPLGAKLLQSAKSENSSAALPETRTLDTIVDQDGGLDRSRSLEQVVAAPERTAIPANTQPPQSTLGTAATARSAKMPKLPSMMEMTGPNAIDAAWIKKSESFSAFVKDSMQAPLLEASRSVDVVRESGGHSSVEPNTEDSNTENSYSEGAFTEGSIANSGGCNPGDYGTIFTWTAPNFYSRPLYFEQVNMERYESKCPPWSRPVVSYAAFLGTIPIVPYKMGGARMHERAYTLGHWRPGDPTPHQIHWGPKTTRGALYQGAATTGLIFFLP